MEPSTFEATIEPGEMRGRPLGHEEFYRGVRLSEESAKVIDLLFKAASESDPVPTLNQAKWYIDRLIHLQGK